MKFIYKFMEVYIWLFMAILCGAAAVQNYEHPASYIGMSIVSGVFLFVYKREKNRVN